MLGENTRYIFGESAWYNLGENYWYIIGRKLTSSRSSQVNYPN
jgi:hypothetical protein